jgi:hypothetical protein
VGRLARQRLRRAFVARCEVRARVPKCLRQCQRRAGASVRRKRRLLPWATLHRSASRRSPLL